MTNKSAGFSETEEQKELRELRESKAKLELELKTKQAEVDSLIEGESPTVAFLPASAVFPNNIEVLKIVRDEHRNMVGYETIEVPEYLAKQQLALPLGARNAHWKDLCYKEDADQRFLN